MDGNGRLHRWLIHHALAHAGYNPQGVAFPASAAILRKIDQYRAVQDIVDMPDRIIDLLHRFLRQGDGRLSQRARQREFAALTHEEAAAIEHLYAQVFEGVAQPPLPARWQGR